MTPMLYGADGVLHWLRVALASLFLGGCGALFLTTALLVLAAHLLLADLLIRLRAASSRP